MVLAKDTSGDIALVFRQPRLMETHSSLMRDE